VPEIKFTKHMVRKLADQVEAYTGGKFGLSGTGMDQGNGVRYFDKHTQTVWFGANGARQVSAYLIGAALEYIVQDKDITEVPDDMAWILDVKMAYFDKKDFDEWEMKGRERARFHLSES